MNRYVEIGEKRGILRDRIIRFGYFSWRIFSGVGEFYRGGTSVLEDPQNPTHTEIDSESYSTRPNLDCNSTFPIDIASNRIPFGFESIGKVYLQSKLVNLSI